MLDDALKDMVTGAVENLAAWIAACNGGGTFTLDDVEWDFPAADPEEATVAPEILRKASHAIGFICGVAAGLDVTPRELLWSLGIDTEAVPAAAAPAAPVTDKRRRKRSHAATVNAKSKTKSNLGALQARIKLTDKLGNERYIYRVRYGWACASRDGTPLAFSYAGIRNETECKFALDDCKTADEVLAVIQRFSSGHTVEAVS